ncbi:MAG: hypothetical protein ABL909_03455 [Sphingopyxis sp.]
MIKTSAILAIMTGIALAAIKLLLAEDLWWPFAIVEYLAAILLLSGAILALRSNRTALLTAGWGFTAGITWSTLFHHLQEYPSAGPVELGLGLLLATAGVGITLAVAPKHINTRIV